MGEIDRKTITDLYVRLCRDSRFTLDAVQAMALTGTVLGLHPLVVWVNMPSFSTAEDIASGNHPVTRALSQDPTP